MQKADLDRLGITSKDELHSALILIFCILGAIGIVLFSSCNVQSVRAEEIKYTNDQIANAIYKAEGGAKTRHPYGIKSINTYGNKEYARKICLNTIRNNRKRFAKQTKYKDFILFLGSRFCPTNIPSEYSLNRHWVKNVYYFLNKG